MKILFFTKYSRMGASSRVRTYQYLPFYEREGVSCTVYPFFNDQYLKELYEGKKLNKINLVKRYLQRLQQILSAPDFDLVVIEKELFPYLPALAERWLRRKKIPFILDYDDAVFHNYDLHKNPLVKKILGNKIKVAMRCADAVVAGNAYIAQYAANAGAAKVVIIPTVINTHNYIIKEKMPGDEIIIGWIGSPTTLKYVNIIKPVLKKICERYPVKLWLAGGKTGIGLGDAEKVIEWSEADEVAIISSFDIGIMPLPESPWERGKCGYKLIQYMGCGIPVIGSPVGVNKDLIDDGINGFKAADLHEWECKLVQLIKNADLRQVLGVNGRKLVEREYALETTVSSWLQLFKQFPQRHA